jgi:hypothetical protein
MAGRVENDPTAEDRGEDVSILKINEINNWLRVWMFMERWGFKAGEPRLAIARRPATRILTCATGAGSKP